MSRRRSRPHVSALCAAALVATAVSAAGAQRAAPGPAELRFVGAVAGAPPQEALLADDVQLLVACRRPVTLGEVLAQGVAFRASRIERLQSAGLLSQAGQRFVATVPIWTADEVSELDSALEDLAAPVVTALLPEFRGLLARLEQLGYPEAMPALASWIVYERAWDYLVAAGMVDVPALVERQRQTHPNRGWWGVLWYEARPGDATPSQRLTVRTDRDRTMLLAWRPDAVPTQLDPANPHAWMSRIITAIRNDRLELRDRDRLEDLARQGLMGEDGRLNAPLAEWRLDQEDGLAQAVQSTVELLAVTVAAQLGGGWAPERLASADPVVARTIAYHGLAPRILAGLTEQGVRARVDAEGPASALVSITTAEGDIVSASRPRSLSVFLWKELPVEMQRPSLPLR